ncbi:1,4-dihydroxy-2-naphthoate octaprenyltransferase [Clostridium magnum]|uniref:1,4-dihydroxy-2-naphthoate octaprenyltransferase n=1 Tax=Clostridium magnum DSM 2767 TaxID=1121326 RepID=A0A168DU46_9CLOT|nr:1,4-dihydroxy-2-naphthoate octaprenyltransferase [Clostridium magnum]KZL91471.1 1,4-dihydroxy-2-naphthoate octaprenyltransferase [Clostridium magnum DSM 2767]SHH43612.1 1,4-dihydroxy-2-naphthoate prenyltransferase [Clostridium magnum DSM 2767]
MKDKFKIWLRATRPFSLTASIIPVTIGAIFATKESEFQLMYYLLSLLAAVLLQASSNMLNDYDDFINKVDTKESGSSSGIIFENLLTPEELSKGGRLVLTLGCMLGLFLAFKKGPFVLILGTIGALSGYFYTGKPLMLKYRGLGAPLIFIIFGPLMMLGGYFVQLQRVSTNVLLLSIPVGLLTTAILHANDIRDIYHDKKAGIKTLSIMVGKTSSYYIYYGLISLSYISVLAMTYFRVTPMWSLLCLITLPTALKNINKLHISNGSNSELATLDQETAKLQGQFGVILIISILFSSMK